MVKINKKFKEGGADYPEVDFTLQASSIKSGGVRLMPGETPEVMGVNLESITIAKHSQSTRKKKKKSGSGASLAIAAGAGLLILKGMG